ncbi:hypothetical protein BDV59DRAFT_46097 [Aspergillus ambiguus]|uniref:uncharacterized protein n=1 Tax=Aspergillus ambiguus TaxID=176160 RepID=UPI003CCD3BB2
MAHGQHQVPGANAFHPGRSRSQSANIRLPAPTPVKQRASSYYPPTEPGIVDDSNPDPFYLEQSLSNGASWAPCQRDMGDARYSNESHPYFMLSTVNSGKDFTFPAVPRGESRANNNRSTLSVVELEYQLGLQQASSAQPLSGPQPCHSSQGSFSSVQSEATPDLTPSSSFSSNYSSPIHPDATKRGNHAYATPYPHPYTILPGRPSTASREAKAPVAPSNTSSDTLIMPHADIPDGGSLRGKALPTMPPVPRIGNPPPGKRGPNPAGRAPIEPSMISPPCRINPVTMEPHTTHFDQALFIPANDCPSPVPSPTPSPASPAMERQPTATSGRDRPSTSASEMYCEQSVWESDSDNEDGDPKSLRKPIDTLKKVRSRVHLRVAKSAPKLQNSQGQAQTPQSKENSQELERFPSIPDLPPWDDLPPPPPMPVMQARSSKDLFRPTAQQTLRLVAPSTTSLVRPRTPRSRGNSCATTVPSRPQTPKCDIDRSTAAAIHAQTRRRQRSDSPDLPLTPQREKLCTLCREERSDRAIHQSLSLVRPPLYKRFWESLRVLGCHGDISPARARKPM